MARVRADPEELRKFTHVIQDETDEMQAAFERLMREFQGISDDSWQDHQREQFSEVLEATARSLDQFLDDIRGQVDSIHKKADLLEEYLRSR